MTDEKLIVKPDSKIKLKNYDTKYTGKYKHKQEGIQKLEDDILKLEKYQDVLYAQNTYALLIMFQAMDAAGKDGTIKHVMSGVNPQGCQVFSFKSPSAEELDHDYLWRCFKCLPERGRIGIFNRSYYEEVLAVRVHPEFLAKQQLPLEAKGKGIWKQRFEEINNFEKYLVNNGIIVLKFFLNVSKEEQKNRFLERIEIPEKNWKLSPNDAKEREFWDDYMAAYEDIFNHTSTSWAPWYIIPADHKWFMRLTVADIICAKLKELNLKYPTVTDEHKQGLIKVKELLENEK
ncbi:MAG: polyphosphate kinase 2 family protein [Prochloraceae cyanobacterium]